MGDYGAVDAEVGGSPRRARIRCLMLCCEKEKELIDRALEGPPAKPGVPGVLSYRVNMLSRMLDVTYCEPAEPSDVVARLNKYFLGASIHESGEADTATPRQRCLRAVLQSPSLYLFGIQSTLWLSYFALKWDTKSKDARWDMLGLVGVGASGLLYKTLARMVTGALMPLDDTSAAGILGRLQDILRPDMNLLMLVASVGAVLIGQTSEAGLLLWLYSAAQLLQAAVVAFAAAQVDGCGAQMPAVAHLHPSGSTIPLDKVAPYTTQLQVRTGEAIPVDGDVVEPTQEAVVDEKAVTGESAPVLKTPGGEGAAGKVSAGTLLVSGFLVVRATRRPETSFAATIQESVQDAASQRTQAQDLVDKFAGWYTTVVLSVAALFFAYAFVDTARREELIQTALLLIVLGCPCALVTASPIVTTCGVASAANAGCLVKQADALTRLGDVTCVAFDKTGTLTDGRFRVADVWIAEGRDNIGKAVAALEATSTHPLAVAIVEHQMGCITDAVHGAKMKDLQALIKGQLDTRRGMGVGAEMEGFGLVRVGNAAYIGLKGDSGPGMHTMGQCNNPPVGASKQLTLDQFVRHRAAKSLVFASVGGVPAACYALYDSPREPSSFDTVEWLQGRGAGKHNARVVLLSGDRQQVVDDVGKMVGIRERNGGLVPEDKLRWVRRLKEASKFGSEGEVVLMAGDGINDAPALAAADVGWAIGVGGTALASQSAHVVQTIDDLCVLPAAVQHGKTCQTLIKQNIVMACAPKITLALLTATSLWMSPLWVAVAADTGCLCLVLLNGMRALQWPTKPQLWAA